MIMQIKTEKELIDMVQALKKEVEQLREQNKIMDTTASVSSNDVLELINKHVTITFINKLYKKGK